MTRSATFLLYLIVLLVASVLAWTATSFGVSALFTALIALAVVVVGAALVLAVPPDRRRR